MPSNLKVECPWREGRKSPDKVLWAQKLAWYPEMICPSSSRQGPVVITELMGCPSWAWLPQKLLVYAEPFRGHLGEIMPSPPFNFQDEQQQQLYPHISWVSGTHASTSFLTQILLVLLKHEPVGSPSKARDVDCGILPQQPVI